MSHAQLCPYFLPQEIKEILSAFDSRVFTDPLKPIPELPRLTTPVLESHLIWEAKK